jgi:hypothetical protein
MLAMGVGSKIEAAEFDLHRSLPLLRPLKILSDSFRPRVPNEQHFFPLHARMVFSTSRRQKNSDYGHAGRASRFMTSGTH